MGASSSLLTEEQLDEYVQLTYLTKSEILYILKKYTTLGLVELQNDIHYRFHAKYVMDLFTELKYNPYCDRLTKVFSSLQDAHFSFEDVLDLCSAMSSNCPLKVKAAWAFKVFDFNEDNQITKDDLFDMLDRLTWEPQLEFAEKNHICDILLNEMDMQHTGGMGQLEFLHAITKIPEFAHAFSFRP